MKKISFVYFLVFSVAFANANGLHKVYFVSPLEGRYDLTLSYEGKTFPAWLEVHHSGVKTLIGQYVGAGGSARPISKINFNNNLVNFSIPPQWDTVNYDLVFNGVFQGDSLIGTIDNTDGKKYSFVGVRAPALRRKTAPVWGNEIKLFNGRDLSGWHTNGPNQWKAENGIMVNPASGSNIMTDQTFNDFKLHIEFRYPKGSNSGVYLRGRYEIQIVDSKGMEAGRDYLGAIYGFIAPLEMMAKDPGEWQSYDVTLIGRLVTLSVNGVNVICNQEIPGITGGALNSNEADPGPIMIQGDHGSIEFRNILLTPAK